MWNDRRCALITSEKIRYLIVGVVNTSFGYFASIYCHWVLKSYISLIFILLLSNLFAISFSFVNYKIFVFKSKGNWLFEYFRAYLVYGATALLGIFLTWVLVEKFQVQFWLSQAIALSVITCISYVGHRNFTFNSQDRLPYAKDN